MVRELRKRASRINYAALLRYEDENGAGPSEQAEMLEEPESGSDFAPEQGEQVPEENHDNDIPLADTQEEDKLLEEERYTPVASVVQRIKAPTKRTKRSVFLAPGVPQHTTPQSYATPSIHHRHRAVPIFGRDGKVERLRNRPSLFQTPSTILTKSWSHNAVVADRTSKAWGYNVGPGPLWELIEDRGWFKEAAEYNNEDTEAYRRPKVHQGIKVSHKIEVLTSEVASKYLPSNSGPVLTEGPSQISSIRCSFGPVSHQTSMELSMFDTVKIDTVSPGSQSHVFDVGAPAWGIDWCPIHPDDRGARSHKQYLAVAPLSSRNHALLIGSRSTRPAYACIQIWSLGPEMSGSDRNKDASDHGEMKCELVLCIESGCAHDLKWCPLPSHDSLTASGTKSPTTRKLGLLAGTFEDGSVSLYVVPDPTDVATTVGSDHKKSKPVFVKSSEPLLRLELEDTACWSFDWANSDVIAVGCANGFVAIYNVGQAIRTGQNGLKQRILPTHYISVHQSAVRAIAWVRAPCVSATGERTADDPTVIATGGYDGMECVMDIREQAASVMNRTRDVVNSICYSTYCGGPITIDQENTVKAYALSPSMLGRGHKLLEPDGPVWSVHASDYHPQLAIGVADGSCLTTNTLRSTRRGGAVPFFVHKIYQLDYSRSKNEYRMLENFLPTESQDRPSATRANKVLPVGTGAWSPEVGIQRVVWNTGNGLSAAGLLASATGSGLCRIDYLKGRWMRDRIPYNGIEGIRQEVDDNFMDEDSD